MSSRLCCSDTMGTKATAHLTVPDPTVFSSVKASANNRSETSVPKVCNFSQLPNQVPYFIWK